MGPLEAAGSDRIFLESLKQQVWSTNGYVLSTFFQLTSSFSEFEKKSSLPTNQTTDGPTNRPTDKASYRDADASKKIERTYPLVDQTW